MRVWVGSVVCVSVSSWYEYYVCHCCVCVGG